MRSVEVTVDVSGATGLTAAATASTVHLPDQLEEPATVVFGYPGGGYGRRYFDIGALPGYSQAEHHTGEAMVRFVACDHLGVGDSSQPDTFEPQLREPGCRQPRDGDSAPRPACARDARLTGSGPYRSAPSSAWASPWAAACSRSSRRTTALSTASGCLGWSGIEHELPGAGWWRGCAIRCRREGPICGPSPTRCSASSPPTTRTTASASTGTTRTPALMEADLVVTGHTPTSFEATTPRPGAARRCPACAVTMMTPGAVAAEAAAIDVPVLVGSGERDVVPEPWVEPPPTAVARASGSSSFPAWRTCTTSRRHATCCGGRSTSSRGR